MKREAFAAVMLMATPALAGPGDGFMTVRPPVNPGDTILEGFSADPNEYVKLGSAPNTLRVKLYGKGCSKVTGFSETEIYNWRVCPDGTAALTDGDDDER